MYRKLGKPTFVRFYEEERLELVQEAVDKGFSSLTDYLVKIVRENKHRVKANV